MKILRRNALALTMLPMFSYLSYSTLQMRAELIQYKDSDVIDRAGRGWIFQKTVYDASRFVALACVFFGE
jgi:hypothetical protein